MSKIDLVFYSGSLILISAVVAIIISKFRRYQSIHIKPHYKIIFIYIILMVLSIILWKLFCNVLVEINNMLTKQPSLD